LAAGGLSDTLGNVALVEPNVRRVDSNNGATRRVLPNPGLSIDEQRVRIATCIREDVNPTTKAEPPRPEGEGG